MAKTDYTKVEEALNEGLLRINISGLHDAAMAASDQNPLITDTDTNNIDRKKLVAALKFEAQHCKSEKLFITAGLSRNALKKLLNNIQDLTPEQWVQLATFHKNAEAFKKEKIASLPSDANDKLVEEQRKKHINKRYNTKERWLPLH
jgi:hypothetical protein